MRLTHLTTTLVSVRARHRIVSSVRDTGEVVNLIAEAHTDSGATGVAYVAAFTPAQGAALRALVTELGDVLSGFDGLATAAAWDAMWRATRLAGHGGLSIMALSVVDMALWDLKGRVLGVPVHTLLGTRRETVPVYASDGCWLTGSPSRVADEAESLVDEGCAAVKVRLGRPDPAADLAVLRAVRDRLRPHVPVMADVNQGWDRATANRLLPALADTGAAWLEEPLDATDTDGLAELRRRHLVPITAGENAYTPDGIAALLSARAVDTVMPDLGRVGGITGWIRAAALTESHRLPITSHLYPDISVHVLAACHGPGWLERVTWMDPLLVEPPRPREGHIPVPTAPGLGIDLDPDALARHRID